MFTGIIEEIGTIKKIDPIEGGKRIKIACSEILDGIKVNDSVSVNGVCLTATNVDDSGFRVDAVGETLKKSTLAGLNISESVNLERALRFNDRLGGHLVQGHVNGLGYITQITKLGENYYLEIEIPENLVKYTIDEGSIAIDGISLTIAKTDGRKISISIIPHTWSNTILRKKRVGDKVNIETDFIAKYIEKFLSRGGSSGDEKFTEAWFKKMGYE